MIEINSNIRIPEDELQFSYARSSGPGGQNVNKVNTKAILHWNVRETPSLPEPVRQRLLAQQSNRINQAGELVLSSDETRDQHRNAEVCRQKLQSMVAQAAVTPKRRKKTKPTKGSQRRRLEGKRQQSEKKQQRREKFRI